MPRSPDSGITRTRSSFAAQDVKSATAHATGHKSLSDEKPNQKASSLKSRSTQYRYREKVRARSQRLPLHGSCKTCGSTEQLERHHERYDIEKPEDFITLCHDCHVNLHKQSGGWGKPIPKMRICPHCNREFKPKGRRKKHCSLQCAYKNRSKRNAGQEKG